MKNHSAKFQKHQPRDDFERICDLLLQILKPMVFLRKYNLSFFHWIYHDICSVFGVFKINWRWDFVFSNVYHPLSKSFLRYVNVRLELFCWNSEVVLQYCVHVLFDWPIYTWLQFRRYLLYYPLVPGHHGCITMKEFGQISWKTFNIMELEVFFIPFFSVNILGAWVNFVFLYKILLMSCEGYLFFIK